MSGYRYKLLAAAAALGFMVITPASAETPYLEARAGAQSADFDERGNFWFDTWIDGMRFVLEPKYRSQSEALLNVLKISKQDGLSANIRFDVSAARFDPQIRGFLYPICSVEVSGQRFQSPRPCDKASYEPRSVEDEAALALAQMSNGSSRAAVAHLDRVLSAPHLKSELRKRALADRAEASSSISDGEVPNSEAADRPLVAALADYRELDALMPDDRYVQYRIAFTLQTLGDYAAARPILQKIQRDYPKYDIPSTIDLATLERDSGNPDAALTLMNGIIERHGQQTDMRYLYHRGWTLNLLGRYDEAIVALSAGIKSQPDYAYAHLRRACAYAGVGRLADAANDLDAAAHYIALLPQAETDSSLTDHLARAKKLAAALRTSISSGANEPTTEVCHGFWGDEGHPRKRSPLLPTQG